MTEDNHICEWKMIDADDYTFKRCKCGNRHPSEYATNYDTGEIKLWAEVDKT